MVERPEATMSRGDAIAYLGSLYTVADNYESYILSGDVDRRIVVAGGLAGIETEVVKKLKAAYYSVFDVARTHFEIGDIVMMDVRNLNEYGNDTQAIMEKQTGTPQIQWREVATVVQLAVDKRTDGDALVLKFHRPELDRSTMSAFPKGFPAPSALFVLCRR